MTKDEAQLAAVEADFFTLSTEPEHVWLNLNGVPHHFELRDGEYVETPWIEL